MNGDIDVRGRESIFISGLPRGSDFNRRALRRFELRADRSGRQDECEQVTDRFAHASRRRYRTGTALQCENLKCLALLKVYVIPTGVEESVIVDPEASNKAGVR